MVDVSALGADARKSMEVRVLSPAPDFSDLGQSPKRKKIWWWEESSQTSGTKIKLSVFFPTNSAARSAAMYGWTGFPRALRSFRRRLEPILTQRNFFNKG